MANLPWRVSVRLMALAKKVAMVIGIIVVVLLAVRVYLSQQGRRYISGIPGVRMK